MKQQDFMSRTDGEAGLQVMACKCMEDGGESKA